MENIDEILGNINLTEISKIAEEELAQNNAVSTQEIESPGILNTDVEDIINQVAKAKEELENISKQKEEPKKEIKEVKEVKKTTLRLVEPRSDNKKVTNLDEWKSNKEDGIITPWILDNVIYPELRKPMVDVLSKEDFVIAIKKSKGGDTGKGYDTTGVGLQWLIDRINDIIGPSHWKTEIVKLEVEKGFTSNNKETWNGICNILLMIGNTIPILYEDNTVSYRFIPVWTSENVAGGSTNKQRADAEKGCYSNALKRSFSGVGLGGEAYRQEIDLDLETVYEEIKQEARAKKAEDGSKKEENKPTLTAVIKDDTKEDAKKKKETEDERLYAIGKENDPAVELKRREIIEKIVKIYHALGDTSSTFRLKLKSVEQTDTKGNKIVIEDEKSLNYVNAVKIVRELYGKFEAKKKQSS
jgi:hypothetical protein